MGLTTAFFAFYKTIWVGISLASIAVEAVATFQILGKKINPVTKMSRFTRPFGLGVLAGGVAGNPGSQNKTKHKETHKPKKVQSIAFMYGRTNFQQSFTPVGLTHDFMVSVFECFYFAL